MTPDFTSIISLFPSALAKEPDRAISVRQFLDMVKAGEWRGRIETLRQHIARGDRARYDAKKRELPAVTLSCHCLSREVDLSPEAKAISHSGWLQADFDLKDNPLLFDAGTMAATREKLIADPYVGAVFVGPSGEGIKALVSIDVERHKDSWFAAEAHFRDNHGLRLDKATKDPMRLCFVSWDPDLAEKDTAIPLPIPEAIPVAADVWHPPIETTAADIEEMLKFIPPRPDYDTWLRVASAVWSVLPMAEGARLLHQWSPEEKDGEYAAKHKARLRQITVGTLAMMAQAHGFDARAAWRRKRWAGRIRFADADRGPGQDVADYQDEQPAAELSRLRIMEAFNAGQSGDASLWCEVRKGLRVWNHHAKMWMVYEDGIWRKDAAGSTPWDISETLTAIYSSLADSIRAEMAANPAQEEKKDPRAKELAKIATRLESLHRWDYVSCVEKFAARKLFKAATEFDRNLDILVVANGVVDTGEGIFREHRPTDFATVASPVNFDPEQECPRWDAFLTRVFPDPDTRAYIARAIGYCLTGRVHFDVLFFAYGKGANGKSTVLGVVKYLLGDMATSVPIAALLAAKSDNNFDYHKASMEGRRVVQTDEIPEGRKLADSQVKAITGGDPINARRPFENPYTFNPTHKLWLMGNHKPEVTGQDHGIWRRIHLVPFLVTIPKEEQRPRHEVLEEFKAEGAGILNWAIRGFLECRDIGLCPPPQVMEATAVYREESDQFGGFLEECTVKNVAGAVGVSTLSRVYNSWCDINGETPRYRGTRQIRKVMAERGFLVEPDRKNHPTVLGLSIKNDEDGESLSLTN